MRSLGCNLYFIIQHKVCGERLLTIVVSVQSVAKVVSPHRPHSAVAAVGRKVHVFDT